MQKNVPISAKNQRPIIWPPDLQLAEPLRLAPEARDARILLPERLAQQDARHAQRLLGDGAHLGHRGCVRVLTSRRTLPTRNVM